MASFGKFDYSQFKRLQSKLNKLPDPDKFINDCAKELAARLLKKVIKRTPVGDYSGASYSCAGELAHKGNKSKGKNGGTLRRGWTIGKIKQSGNTVYIEIINPVEYAPYVEYGHRTRGGNGWVSGHFMLKTSAEEVQAISRSILEEKMEEYFKGVQ